MLIQKENGEVIDLLTLRVQLEEKINSMMGELQEFQATAKTLDKALELETETKTRERIARGEATAADKLRVAFEGLAPNTQRSYQRILKVADKFFDGVEITDSRLAEYLRHRFEHEGVSFSVLRQIVCAVRFRAKARGEKNPVETMCSDVLRRFRRQAASRGRGKAKALLQADVSKMVEHCEVRGIIGARDAAMISLGFECLLRVSELVGLRVDDLAPGEDGHGSLLIRRSKTDQSGEGAWVFVGAPVYKRVTSWIKMSGIESGPIFRKVMPNGVVWNRAMNPNVVNTIIQARARQVGIKGAVRSHSLRRGAAQQLTLEGRSIQEVASAGRWKSPVMVMNYCQSKAVNRGAVARRYQRS